MSALSSGTDIVDTPTLPYGSQDAVYSPRPYEIMRVGPLQSLNATYHLSSTTWVSRPGGPETLISKCPKSDVDYGRKSRAPLSRFTLLGLHVSLRWFDMVASTQPETNIADSQS